MKCTVAHSNYALYKILLFVHYAIISLQINRKKIVYTSIDVDYFYIIFTCIACICVCVCVYA